MDPKACWEMLVASCESGDMAAAAALASDLDEWRRKGGFRPECIPADVWTQGALRDFAMLCRATAGLPCRID